MHVDVAIVGRSICDIHVNIHYYAMSAWGNNSVHDQLTIACIRRNSGINEHSHCGLISKWEFSAIHASK